MKSKHERKVQYDAAVEKWNDAVIHGEPGTSRQAIRVTAYAPSSESQSPTSDVLSVTIELKAFPMQALDELRILVAAELSTMIAKALERTRKALRADAIAEADEVIERARSRKTELEKESFEDDKALASPKRGGS